MPKNATPMSDSLFAVPVRNRFTNEVQFTAQVDCSPDAPLSLRLGLAVKWAVKEKADLRSADLRSADLRSADLRSADLRSADLRSANLRSANLSSANLSSANLRSADLRSAENLGDWTMTDGLKFSRYLAEVVPALLTAGGKTLAEIQASGCWDCHSWENCPMRVAFGISDARAAPPLLRGRVIEFIQLFDSKLIPAPWAA